MPSTNDAQPASANVSLERAIIESAWRDHHFAALLETDPGEALARLGVELPSGIRLDIRMQRRDTLYFVVPPLANPADGRDGVLNQMDLWQSAECFCWIMPQALKLGLLAMRQSFRRAHS